MSAASRPSSEALVPATVVVVPHHNVQPPQHEAAQPQPMSYAPQQSPLPPQPYVTPQPYGMQPLGVESAGAAASMVAAAVPRGRLTLAEVVYREEPENGCCGCRCGPDKQRSGCAVGTFAATACLILGLTLLGVWLPEAARSCDREKEWDCFGPGIAAVALFFDGVITLCVVSSIYACYRGCCPRIGKVCADEWACCLCRALRSGRIEPSAVAAAGPDDEPADHPCYDCIESCEQGLCCQSVAPVSAWNMSRDGSGNGARPFPPIPATLPARSPVPAFPAPYNPVLPAPAAGVSVPAPLYTMQYVQPAPVSHANALR